MRKVKLVVEVELEVNEGYDDEEVYSAICMHFSGPDGMGLTTYPFSKEAVAPKVELHIHDLKNSYGMHL